MRQRVYPFAITSISSTTSHVHHVYTQHANWIILSEAGRVTLIDGGYPQHTETVIASLAQLGFAPEDIVAALLTHAHIDHLGGLIQLAQRFSFPIYVDSLEKPHAQREVLHQCGPFDIAKMIIDPTTPTVSAIGWVGAAIALGGLNKSGLPQVQELSSKLLLPGSPLPVPSYGHTDGHCAFLVADGNVLVSGDALITGHAMSKKTGPQLIHHLFHHQPTTAQRTLGNFSNLAAQTLFPGHGKPMPINLMEDLAQLMI